MCKPRSAPGANLLGLTHEPCDAPTALPGSSQIAVSVPFWKEEAFCAIAMAERVSLPIRSRGFTAEPLKGKGKLVNHIISFCFSD